MKTGYRKLETHQVRYVAMVVLAGGGESRQLVRRIYSLTHIAFLFLLLITDASVAPALYHVDRFAEDRGTIGTLLEFNRHYRSYLCRLQQLYPNSETLSIVCCETDQLYRAWDLLRDAKIETWSVPVRRKALGQLLEKIGYEAFMMGRMPPHVPVWRFTWLR